MDDDRMDHWSVSHQPWEPTEWSAPDEVIIAIDYHLHTYLFDLTTRKRFYDEVASTNELLPDMWEPEQLEYLRKAIYSLYRRLVACARAGWPERNHDNLLRCVGNLVSLLDRRWLAANAESQKECLSVERLLVVASAMEAGPHEGKRALKMLDSQNHSAAIERALLQLHNGVLGHETAIVLLAINLPDERREEVILEQIASSRREDVRLTLLNLLTGLNDEPGMGTILPLFSMETTEKLVRRGLTDPAPRVRRQAASYAVGLGIVEQMRQELEIGAKDDADALTREVFVAALQCADSAKRS